MELKRKSTRQRRGRALLMGLVALALTCSAAAGATPKLPQRANSTSSASAARKNHRNILHFLSTYGVVSEESVPPLTVGQKFRLAVKEFVNPVEPAKAAFKAEYYRGIEVQKRIGHGSFGYVKQWGASYLDGASESMLGNFVYPSLFHQDPRYFRRGTGSIFRRIRYALSRVVIRRGDNGHEQLNVSTVLASATASAISNTYYPPTARTPDTAVFNLGMSLLGNAGSNLFREFWPDVVRKFGR